MIIGRLLTSLLLGLALAAGVTAANSGASLAAVPTAKNVVHVTIRDFSFTPATLRIKAGTTVVWTNRDAMAHTVTGLRGHWGSGTLAQGHTYAHTFTKAGIYAYRCAFHSFMTAKVIVRK